jgi:tRNA dimethylallyltransferase
MGASEVEERPPVVVVTGPTGAGKSEAAVRLAERFGGEIVNADSVQVYRHLEIGTAKPGPDARARVPHWLLDVVDPDVPYNAGRYCTDARSAAGRIHARGRVVFLTGGTGLYIRAFLEGLLEKGGGADPELRRRLEEEAQAAQVEGDSLRLYRRLEEVDPESAREIHPHDTRRVIRALEIRLVTGQPASSLRRDHGFGKRPYRSLHLALDPGRDELDRRTDRRCERMIASGLLQEVRGLYEMGYGPELRPLQSIGYRHMHPVVEGSDTLANALVAMQRDTRRFARRQRTWLRSVPDVRWIHPDDEALLVEATQAFLARAPEAPAARAQ